MKRLWITEKPDMARSLANGLVSAFGTKITNASSSSADGCIKLENQDVVTFLFGHMLEHATPQDYLSAEQNTGDYFKFLPLIPDKFIKYPKADRTPKGGPKLNREGKPVPPRQFSILMKLLQSAPEIVNAGDTDREGQLIVDELLEYAGIDPEGRKKPIWRLRLENPKPEEIAKLIKSGLEKNGDEKWVRRRLAAQSRSESDWCLGMTSSMAYQQVTGYRRMSIGRVQTPVMAMVVARDRAIENFKPVQFYVPVITLADGTVMTWEKREGAEGQPGFDEQGRIISKAVADAIVSRVGAGQQGTINLAEVIRKRELQPLAFSLGTLQSTAARRHGLTLQEVSKAAQSLYERHRAITYVGTDCQFLPTSMLDQAHETLGALSRLFGKEAHGSNPDIRSRTWDDSKTDEHFGIAPTGTLPVNATPEEKAVFETISKRYMAQFYPVHEFLRHRIGAVFSGDSFKSVRKEVTQKGWKQVEGDGDDEEDASDIVGEDETKQHRQTQK